MMEKRIIKLIYLYARGCKQWAKCSRMEIYEVSFIVGRQAKKEKQNKTNKKNRN